MSDSESKKNLHEYLIRPRSQNLEQVIKLQERLNKQLVDKKLTGECALVNSLEPVVLVETDLGLPALFIKCTSELAILIVNMKDIFRFEPAKGQFRWLP